MDESHIGDIARVIQLAIAPVFMLTAIAGIINALLGRLGRAIDRRRTVEALLPGAEGDEREEYLGELGPLARRIKLVIWSIGLAVFSALLICLLIGTAFLGAYISVNLTVGVGFLFFASVLALTASLLIFLREVMLAAVSLHLEARPKGAAKP
jgi:Protein of unknown function (DUF2721)